MITNEQIAKALDRIARTPDGKVLYQLLQRAIMDLPATTDSGALLVHHGERILASRIRSLMNTGIVESGGADTSIITFAVAGASSVSGTRGAGRRGSFSVSEPDTPAGRKG